MDSFATIFKMESFATIFKLDILATICETESFATILKMESFATITFKSFPVSNGYVVNVFLLGHNVYVLDWLYSTKSVDKVWCRPVLDMGILE